MFLLYTGQAIGNHQCVIKTCRSRSKRHIQFQTSLKIRLIYYQYTTVVIPSTTLPLPCVSAGKASPPGVPVADKVGRNYIDLSWSKPRSDGGSKIKGNSRNIDVILAKALLLLSFWCASKTHCSICSNTTPHCRNFKK